MPTKIDPKKVKWEEEINPAQVQWEGESTVQDFAKDVTNPLQAGMIAAGRGFYNVGRGLGLVDEPDQIEQQAMQDLEKKYPKSTMVGEAIGEAAPFVPAGVGIGSVPSLVGRVATGAALGGAEGGIIAKGRGQDPISGALIGSSVGGVGELVLPFLGRAAGKVYRRVTGRNPVKPLVTPDGKPTKELQSILDESGLSFDDLNQEALVQFQRSTNLPPEQLARKQFLESQGLTGNAAPLRAQVTRDATDFQLQQEAAKTAGPARKAIEAQESVLTTRFDDTITGTGGSPNRPSNTVIDTVVDKATKLDNEIGRLYSEARDRAGDDGVVRFNTLLSSLKRKMRADQRTRGNVSAIVGELEDKGIIDQNMNIVGRVGVNEAEEIRQFINSLFDPSNDFGNIVLREMKQSLDDDVFRATGKDLFQQARKAKSSFEEELKRAKISKFDARKRNLVRDLLENKVDPDRFVDNVVLGRSWRDEDLAQLKEYVGDGPAWNDLKAEILDTIKNKAFIGPEDEKGFRALSRAQLERTLDRIGENKLRVIFSPPEVKFLKDMLRVAKLREPVRMTQLGKGPSAQAVQALERRFRNFELMKNLFDFLDVDSQGKYVLKAKPKTIPVKTPPALPGAVSAAAIPVATPQEEE